LPRFFSVSPIFCSFCFLLPSFPFLSWAHLPVLRGFRFLTLRLALQQARCAIRGLGKTDVGFVFPSGPNARST
jgi:hypothetical protein